jgi:thiol-disulfide isomerase/thioredoxin
MTRLGRLVAAPLAAALVLAGCGGTDASPAPASAARPAAAASPGAATTGAVPKQLAFQARTLDGGAFSGASLLGRPAVIWFWAPWCAVCRGEAPDVAAVAERFQGKVAFLGIAGQDAVPAMKGFVKDEKLGFIPHVADEDGELWASFGVDGQPSHAFVHPDGKVDVVPGALSRDDLTARTAALAG